MHESQLSFHDAANYYVARTGWITDWMMFWVFDSAGGTQPSREEIADQFLARTDLFDQMNRRIADVPGCADYPYWITGDSGVLDHIEFQGDDTELTWADCTDRIDSLLGIPLDARIKAWRVTVFPSVHDVPTLTGVGTVVVLQVSHALMVGSAMSSVSRAMFGAQAEPVVVEGLGPPATPFDPIVATARGIARIPGQILRLVAKTRRQRAALRRGDTPASHIDPPRTPTLFNRHPGDARAMRTFRLDLREWRKPGTTVTAAGMTAIAEAMQQYLESVGEACPPELTCSASVAVSGAEAMGVNRVAVAVVSLSPDIESLADRARAVQASLEVGTQFAASPANLDNVPAASGIPYAYYRAVAALEKYRAAPQPLLANSILTSIKCEESLELALCGRPLAMVGMVPALGRNIALAHSMVGIGDILTVSVLCSPSVVEDVDRYAELLEQAFTDVGAALRA